MAERPTEFFYHNIELFKSENLGSGAYGGVCKAKCDGLLCAAKIMHPTLFDNANEGRDTYLRKFREECHLLSLAKHPNVVQYLGTYTDPDTHLPVLLMELCQCSLSAFLEQSSSPLSFNVEVNICHDIALALVYLHSNGLIHRDLTGNNILMLPGPRAKVTDFGMSKLATAQIATLTTCPGNLLYMPPEALDGKETYNERMDSFSFGVIIIQILTRLFPKPTDRFRIQSNRNPEEEEREIREVVPETERRASHLNLIPDIHSLKPLALQCLKKKAELRPSAHEMSESVFELKQSSQYKESTSTCGTKMEQLEQQLLDLGILHETQTRQVEEQLTQIADLDHVVCDRQRQIDQRDRQLNEKEGQIKEKEEEIITRDTTIEHLHELICQETRVLMEEKNEILEDMQTQLTKSESVVLEMVHNLEEKDQEIKELKIVIFGHKMKIQRLEHTNNRPLSLPQAQEPPREPIKEVGRMISKLGEKAPEPMARGSAAVLGSTAYFSPSGSSKVYAYHYNQQERWSQLPNNPNTNFSLAVVDGLLTSIGGCNQKGPTNKLYSFNKELKWFKCFPSMPTPRDSIVAVSNEVILVVAAENSEAIEVMAVSTKIWASVSPLPQKFSTISIAMCGNSLYLAGGYLFPLQAPIFTCPLHALAEQRNVPWKEGAHISSIVNTELFTFGGELYAVGENVPIHRYNPSTDSWKIVNETTNSYRNRFVVALPNQSIMLIGGITRTFFGWKPTNDIEILE